MCISRFFVLLGFGLSFRNIQTADVTSKFFSLREFTNLCSISKNAFQEYPAIHTVKIKLASIYLDIEWLLTDRQAAQTKGELGWISELVNTEGNMHDLSVSITIFDS